MKNLILILTISLCMSMSCISPAGQTNTSEANSWKTILAEELPLLGHRNWILVVDIGLVHANAQLFFASELGYNRAMYSNTYLEKLCRYWVARYGAYPVMWTTGQEVDNDFYHGRMIDGKDIK